MSLDELRKKIDSLDKQILDMLNDRARCAIEIAQIKRDSHAPFYVPEREKAVLDKLRTYNEGPLSPGSIKCIYREVMSAIRALEKPTSVAFLGPRDTFSHMAAVRIFGTSAEYHPLPSFSDVFTEVERKRIDYGVVPVESSVGGSVGDILDRFVVSEVKVVNELLLHITQNLLSNHPIEQIERIYSKDNALLQCRNWLRANLPRAELIETSSTAEAAKRASEEEGAAAIASRMAAETYSLNIVAARIEDEPHNYTRFFVIGRQMVNPTGNDKTAVVVFVRDKPGALYKMLLPFSQAGINLTRIESRPSRKKAWEYVFFIDLLGHAEDENVRSVLEEVADRAVDVKILGSFPRAELEE